MDRPLTELAADLTMHTLATSALYEPFPKRCLESTIEGLRFLENLGPLTQLSLEPKRLIQEHWLSQKAPNQLSTLATLSTPTIPSTPSGNKSPLLQALLKLQKSKKSSRSWDGLPVSTLSSIPMSQILRPPPHALSAPK